MGKRIDDNHRAIVAALRQHPGVRVFSTAAVGKGVPDIVIADALTPRTEDTPDDA